MEYLADVPDRSSRHGRGIGCDREFSAHRIQHRGALFASVRGIAMATNADHEVGYN
jgi:hypothetical protein